MVKKDIIFGAPRDYKAYVKLGNGDGTFGVASDMMGSVLVSQFQIIDINHDGSPDLLKRGSGDYKIYINNGSGIFSLSTTVSTSITYGASYVADLNGDTWPDIVTVDSFSAKILLNDQAGGFAPEITNSLAYSLYPKYLRVLDVDADGNKDLIMYDITYKDIIVFTGKGDGTFDYPLMYPVKAMAPIAILDLNNDGKKDIFSSNIIIQN